MLDLLRRKVKSPYMQAILLVIILVFVFWGTNINKGGRQAVVATVNGESITYENFDKAYNNAVDHLSNRFGGTLPKDLIDREQIKIQVINQLIRELLIQQSAREMGLLASRDEIKENILENEVFLVDGQFDEERYKLILTGSRLTADDYEAGIAFGLLADKLTKYLGRFARVSPGEEKEHFTYDYQESNLLYVTFNASDFKEKVELTDNDLNSFFNEKQDDYRTPPLIKIKYLSFTSEDISEKDKSASLVFQRANTAYENIILSGSLAKYSETGEAVIRETDFFSKESPPEGITRDPSFLEAAFNLKNGELSSLIETLGGYVIIFVDDIKGSEIPSFEEVKEDVKTDFVAARAENLAKETAESLLEKIKSGEDFSARAKELGVTVEESDFVSRTKNYSKKLPYSVIEKGLGLSSHKPYPDNVESTGATFYVFRLKEKKMPEKDQFEGKQEELRKRLLQKKNINLLTAWAEYLRSRADISINPEFI